MTKNDMKFLDKIVVATYICDFGNIVINGFKKRIFKIVNYSNQLPLEFVFESKYYKSAGFSIIPERVKIPFSESQVITISYVTKKNNHTYTNTHTHETKHTTHRYRHTQTEHHARTQTHRHTHI